MNERVGIPDFEAAFYIADTMMQSEHGEVCIGRYEVGNLAVTSGKIVACDAYIPDTDVFTQTVPVGNYPVIISFAEFVGGGGRGLIAAAMLRLTQERPVVWAPATVVGRSGSDDEPFSYGVDCGTGCFADVEAMRLLLNSEEVSVPYMQTAHARLDNTWPFDNGASYDTANIPLGGGLNIIVFTSGEGDGTYPSYFGYDRDGSVACLATDFGIIAPLPYHERPGKEQLTLGF